MKPFEWANQGKSLAETYPAECYGWFDGALGSKGDQNERKKFGAEKARLSLGQNVG